MVVTSKKSSSMRTRALNICYFYLFSKGVINIIYVIVLVVLGYYIIL